MKSEGNERRRRVFSGILESFSSKDQTVEKVNEELSRKCVKNDYDEFKVDLTTIYS